MAQVWTTKQQNWVGRFSAQVVALLDAADELTALCTEFTVDAYGTGGGNALTDSVVQGQLPAATAAIVASAEGAVAGSSQILATISANRGYLEAVRP
jgi:hypothetical protein